MISPRCTSSPAVTANPDEMAVEGVDAMAVVEHDFLTVATGGACHEDGDGEEADDGGGDKDVRVVSGPRLGRRVLGS
jgi:hypothetical protein